MISAFFRLKSSESVDFTAKYQQCALYFCNFAPHDSQLTYVNNISFVQKQLYRLFVRISKALVLNRTQKIILYLKTELGKHKA